MSRIQLGDMPLKKTGNGAAGEIIERAGEKYFRIANYDRMQPFFMAADVTPRWPCSPTKRTTASTTLTIRPGR